MAEQVGMDEVFQRIEHLQANFSGWAGELCQALERVRVEGQRIHTKENAWEFQRAKDKLTHILSVIRQAIHRIGDGANMARMGNPSVDDRALCDFLYETFMPGGGSAL